MAAESIKEVSFKVHRPVAGVTSMMVADVSFKLGLGPCGRFVSTLESSIDYHGITVTQTSYPDDFGHVRESLKRLNERNVSNWLLIVGPSDYKGHRSLGHGFGNLEFMTPSKEEHEANIKLASEFLAKYHELHKQAEIKAFFYKLEDVRGRIVVLR